MKTISIKRILFWGGLIIAIGILIYGIFYLRILVLADRNYLSDLPCSAPCWQDITPGQTTRPEVIEKLKNLEYIQVSSIKEAGNSEYGGVTWYWKFPITAPYQNSISWDKNIVQEIRLGVYNKLTVEEVIGIFGPPEGIDVGEGGVPEHWYLIFDLYYPSKGIQFTVHTALFSSTLEPGTMIRAIEYYSPMTLEERLTVFYYGIELTKVMGLVRQWKGYGDIFITYYGSREEYYRLIDELFHN